MTCIVAIGNKSMRTVTMAADSLSSNGHFCLDTATAKVFNAGDFIVGIAGDWRFGQVLAHRWEPPAPPGAIRKLDQFMATDLIDSIRSTMKGAGKLRTSDGVEEIPHGWALIGYKGRLWVLQPGLSIIRGARDFGAVGSGQEAAFGSLLTSAGLPWTDKIRCERAVMAACEVTATVAKPIRHLARGW